MSTEGTEKKLPLVESHHYVKGTEINLSRHVRGICVKRGPLLLLIALVFIVLGAGAFLFLNDDADGIQEPDDLVGLLTEAGDNIRAAETFRMEIRQEGIAYRFLTDLGDGAVEVGFRRSIGQYVAPNEIQLDVSVTLGSLTTSVLTYGRGLDQWYRLPVFGWIKEDFAAGFDPETLIAEDTGFQAALEALIDIEYDGAVNIDGTTAYKLRGSADGTEVADLLVGLIEDEGEVDVEVYINVETRYPIRITIIQKETDPDDPMTWLIDLYDINAPRDIDLPPELTEDA